MLHFGESNTHLIWRPVYETEPGGIPIWFCFHENYSVCGCVGVFVWMCVCGCVRARPSVWVRARLSVCVWSCLRARVDAHEFGFACAHKGGIKYKWCA